jgi:hypothetical protein
MEVVDKSKVPGVSRVDFLRDRYWFMVNRATGERGIRYLWPSSSTPRN